jgi:hypothetical protein
MKHLKLTFEDIMQSNILYYDKASEAACFDICNYLSIDNMPDIDGEHFYELHNGQFQKEVIADQHKVSSNISIFSQENLEKFKVNRHNVLFACEELAIRGIVHLSDYNRDVVLQYIQDDVLAFERKLRQLILLHNYQNHDIKTFFEYRRDSTQKSNDRGFYQNRIDTYNNRQNEINSLGAFQIFDFSDILNFAGSSFTNQLHKIGKYSVNNVLKDGTTILRDLRNLAMHGKNPVSIDKSTSIYSLESLEKLFESLSVLRKEYASVTMKIRKNPDFLRSIELENRGKLEIIHKHHPKALEYFLGF